MQSKGTASSEASAPASDPLRARLLAAILELSGELGYRRTTTQAILARADIGRARFRGLFAGKGECFAAAHAEEVDRLAARLLRAARLAPDEPLPAALEALRGYVAERPLVARAVLREVYVAGGAARAKHEEVLERLSGAPEWGACRETVLSHGTSPPLSAPYMVGAIEGVVRFSLSFPRPADKLAALTPDLLRFLAATAGAGPPGG